MPDPKDYEELTNLEQDLSRVQIKAAQANIDLDRELMTLSTDRAKIMRALNDDQKKFLSTSGAQQIFIAKENLEIEQKAIQAKMMSMKLSKDDTTRLQHRLEFNQSILTLTDETLDSLKQQADWMNDAENTMFDVEDINKNILAVQVELETLAQNHLGLLDSTVSNYQIALETNLKSLKVQQKSAQVAEIERKAAAQGSKIFGITTDTIKERAQEIQETIMSWPVLLGAALTVGLRTFETLRKEAQLGIGQTFELIPELAAGWTAALKSGVVVTTEEAAAAVGDLANAFGRMDFISGDLIKKQIRLTTIYGMQGEQSAELLEVLQIVGQHSEEFTTTSLEFMENLARANDIPIGALMSDVAMSAQNMAIASEENLSNLIQSVAQARRLGLDIGKVVAFAESSVMNPDNFIQNVARLRQFGFQIADPIGLMALANDPSRQAELVDEIVRTFSSTGRDLASLTRIERSLLEDTFGMTFEEIRKVASRAHEGVKLMSADAGDISKGRDLAQNLAASTLRFVKDVDMAGLALNALAASALLRGGAGLLGGAKGLLGKLGMGGAAAGAGRGLLGGMGGAAAGLGRGALRMAPGLGAGIEGVLNVTDIAKGGAARTKGLFGLGAGAIGAGIGGVLGAGAFSVPGALIGGAIGSAVGRMVAPKAVGDKAVRTAAAVAPQPREQVIFADTTALERKMDELIVAYKTHQSVVEMDGIKVGQALRKGEPRTTSTAA